MKATSITIMMLLIPLELLGCKYKGDGTFKDNGTWPFKNYTLEFDSFPLKTGETRKLNIGKIGKNTTVHIYFTLSAETDVQFSVLSPEVSFSLHKYNSPETLLKSEFLFKHFHRMQSESKASWPNDDEWHCRFNWDDPEIINRAVSFKSESPLSTNKLTCHTSIENPKEELQLEIKCQSCEFPVVVQGQLSFSSGWK